MTKIDKKDKRIIYELDTNSRQTNAEISKKVGLSKDAVGYRIKSLEKNKIIKGYRTVIDSSKLGYISYRCFFNLIDLPPKKFQILVSFLEKEKNTWWIAKLDGEWNFNFVIWVKSNNEFQQFYKIFTQKFRENIKEKLICPLTSYTQFSRTYLLDNKISKKTKSILGERIEKFDNKDLEILKILSKNAREPLIEMAHKLNMDSMTIFHRIKNLEKKEIITGYNIDINFSILKKEFYSVKINLKNSLEINELESYIKTIPELTATIEALGSYDIEFDLEVDSSEQYFQIIEKIENKFNSIREIIYLRVLKNYKVLYMPEI